MPVFLHPDYDEKEPSERLVPAALSVCGERSWELDRKDADENKMAIAE
jgi:hypothetical protein